MEKIISVKSTDDVVRLLKEAHDLLYNQLVLYVEDKSTTRLLFNGVVTLSTIYIIKSYITALLIKRRSGLKGPMPLPIIGNFHSIMVGGLDEVLMKNVKKYGKTSIFFEGMKPVIQTADPEIAKAITIKDFRYFTSRRMFGFENTFLFDNMMTSVDGDKWKNIRSIVTTVFTAGKLKLMTSNIKVTSDIFCEYLEGLVKKDELLNHQKYQNFATDVVCSNFFGIAVDTINYPNHSLPIAIKKSFGVEFFNDLRFLILIFYPNFGKFILEHKLISIFHAESLQYITQVTNQIIEDRRSKKTVRNDFIQMMVDNAEPDTGEEINKEEQSEDIKAYKNLKKTLTNAEILSQSIMFMMAGSETTSTALSWISYNLAMHPDIQDKLIQEIDDALERHNGEINYDSVNDVEYLNSVISETQRMYGITFTDRQCTKDYEINGVKFKAGDSVNILLSAMMHDEETYPNPEKFIPDRKRPNDSFIPFGSGPRVCVAQRFALLEMKVLLVSVLKSYRFQKCDKTLKNPAVDSSSLGKPKEDIFLKVVRR